MWRTESRSIRWRKAGQKISSARDISTKSAIQKSMTSHSRKLPRTPLLQEISHQSIRSTSLLSPLLHLLSLTAHLHQQLSLRTPTTPSGMKTAPFTPTPPPISSPLLPGHPFLQLSLPPVPSSLQRTLTGIPSLTPPTVSVVSCRGVLQYGLKTHLASIAARISGMFV
jgi:hypothetical protein